MAANCQSQVQAESLWNLIKKGIKKKKPDPEAIKNVNAW